MLHKRGCSHKMFARVSPVFVLACFFAGMASSTVAASSTAPTATLKRIVAAQFQKAEQQRAALSAKPQAKRTLADYRQVVLSYRRVYLITPRANEVPEALQAVSQLYSEMGERFGRSYYQSAVDTYQFLVREYPNSRYGPDAMLACAKLQSEQLGDLSAARQTYQDFSKRYPRSSRKREVQEAVAELALLQNGAKPGIEKAKAGEKIPAPAPESPAGNAISSESSLSPNAASDSLPPLSPSSRSTGMPRLRRVRSSATADSTRVTIDMENVVKYASGRLANPDRIFFDLRAARVSPEVARESVKVEGNLLSAVRVAQYQNGIVRVVLDVHGVKEYAAAVSENPPQLIIDLYKKTPPPGTLRAKQSTGMADPRQELADSGDGTNSEASGEVAVKAPAKPSARKAESATIALPESDNAADIAKENSTADNSLRDERSAKKKSVALPLKNSKNGSRPELLQPAAAPQPTHDGQSTLTRALGLKIGRIVIDAGHGGHDTGTIGPTGLMEKDLCLDVASRLGKIIKQRLPGAEVVFTRSDDSFIPLEERTAIANEAHADLFISIHANSSQDTGARGIETYYLNLKGSPEAMEVAARENAVSQVGIHDLEDLVKKIARNEKIDESKEFAEDIQNSLSQRVQKTNKTVKNRGVRKAPFMVLIGADMPSILTEISFLSNPADEQLLKKPEHRQRVAEGLYQGVASYLQSLNSVTFNTPMAPSTPRSTSSALEQSRNHQ